MPVWAERVSRRSGLAAAAVGVVVLIGWLAGLPLMDVFPSYLPTKVNSAVLIVLAGAALAFPISRRAGALIGLVVAGVAAATLTQWIIGVDLGIDQLLLDDETATSHPGRPSPGTAAALLFFGVAQAARISEHRVAGVIRVSAAVAGSAVTLAIELGYLYGVPHFVIEPSTGVPLPSLAALVLLSAAHLAQTAAHPPLSWLTDGGVTGRFARSLIPLALVAPVALGTITEAGHRWLGLSADTRLVVFTTLMVLTLAAITIDVGFAISRADKARDRLARELSATFEHLPASMSLRDRDGVFLRVNKTFAEDTQFDPAAILGQPMERVYPAHLLQWARREVDEVLASREPSHSEFVADLGQGSRTFDVTRYPVFDSDGTAIGLGTFGLDITARKDAERRAAEAAARVESYLDSAPDATVVVDEQGIVQYANPQLATVLGYDPAEIIGRSVDLLVPESSRAGHAILRGQFGELPTRRAMGGLDLTARHRDGHAVPVEVSLGPVPTDDGMWTLAAIRDVTEKRAVDAALRAAEERYRTDLELAAIVQQRLLPAEPPRVPGYQLAARFIPAGEVGGDFYDWWYGDGALRLLLADVMGKGAGAAIVGAGVRTLLTAAMNHLSPADAITRAATDLAADLAHTNRFATCFAARLDPVSGLLEWADAGHGLATILHADGSHTWLDGTDLPLGVDGQEKWTHQAIHLAPDDILLAASDGLLDTIGGRNAIAELAQGLREGGPDRIVAGLTVDVEGAADDLTVIAVRREALTATPT